MYPVNQYMDPYYSHYRNHTPYPHYPPPGWEVSHPRALDSSYRPPSYGPWPYNAGIHHPHPSEFHCCCNHTYPIGYYNFRPPFPQELPPAHLYYHVPFPQHQNECPYFARPHPYTVEQTPYDDKKFKSHCCGCPNHVCHEDKSNMKIEEERPDVKLEGEHKDADSASIIRHPNNHYPLLWLPSGNMEDKENGRRYELTPQFLNGWVPPVSSKGIGDVKQQEQDNQKSEQFQCPELKEMDESPKVCEEAPQSPKIKIIPLSWFQNDPHGQKPAAKDGPGDHGDRPAVKSQPATAERNNKTTPVVPKRLNNERKPARENYKTIPVVPEKVIDEKVGTLRTIPVMTEKESDEKKPGVDEKKEVKKASNAEKEGENGKTNHGESSTAKHSKLPPVCLRVDPLPRKKSGNGSSRSPSPPTRKDADRAKKDVKKPKQSDTKKHITMSKVKEKSPNEMKKGMGFNNETVQAASAKHAQEEEVPTSKDDQRVQASSTSVDAQENVGAKNLHEGHTQENAGAESLQGGDKSTNEDEIIIQSESAKDDARICRINLSEQDASIRIQSAYRGYDVRRWQPLDKLRKIRDVHEQLQSVRNQLQSLETSSKKPTEKEQVAISETIMNLLLKLDTIQGLHPSVRETRKSVARELICLQEKLDTLCKLLSGEFNHTNSEEDEPNRAESVIQTAAPTLTSEASDKDEKALVVLGLGEAKGPSSVNSVELCDTVPSRVSVEVMQDADSSEQKNKKEESCTTRMEVAHEEGKAAVHIEFKGASSMDMMSDAALPEHPAHNQECHIEESNSVSMEEVTEEEKTAVEDEGQEVPIVDSMEPLHDAASSGDFSGMKQCTASTGQNLLDEESNTGVSPAATEDIKATTATASLDSRLVTDKDGSVEGQIRDAVGVESPELKQDVPPAEAQHNESSAPIVNVEDSSVSLKDAEPHEHDPTRTIDSVMSNADDQPEEVRGINMQEQVAAITQDLTKEQDETPEASMDDTKLAASADAEKPDQAALLEPTSESDSAREQTALEESDDAVQCEVSGKDDSPHVDQRIEPTVDKLTGGSAKGEDPLLEASRKEPDIQESHPNIGEETDDTKAETVFPELDSCGLSCVHEDGITGSCVDAQVSETDECNEALKEAPAGATGAHSAEEVDVRPNNTPVHATVVNSAEKEADSPKEDVDVQTENKASEEAFSASATPDSLKDSDEKGLAEENQKLKELLHKLLASGNDQMGVITDLSEKVKVLERKLARKKRPKVRVHRPAGHATAKVH
ncbi:BAG family molecular chaperone regulator 6 [Phragmites australis]|uniref:BAG family molecular chaperone regulator 6 n=1 Tax=Phragmites australis TaxID=29695 RepID=UPI002D79EDCA|nr:BAG family molecular chaperone regulator 6 [Phragmites australis]